MILEIIMILKKISMEFIDEIMMIAQVMMILKSSYRLHFKSYEHVPNMKPVPFDQKNTVKRLSDTF